MTRASTHSPPPGQVLVPASAIGGLAILLAAGLQALRVLDRANAAVARAVSPGPAADFPNQLPGWLIWLAPTFILVPLMRYWTHKYTKPSTSVSI